MKNARLPLVVIILCIALGCRKDLHKNTSNHLNQYTQTGSKEDLNSINKNGIIASGWQGTNDWVQVNLPTHTVYYTNLKTAVADYTSQEVVRVFKNSP